MSIDYIKILEERCELLENKCKAVDQERIEKRTRSINVTYYYLDLFFLAEVVKVGKEYNFHYARTRESNHPNFKKFKSLEDCESYLEKTFNCRIKKKEIL